jgi:hypothetical protein
MGSCCRSGLLCVAAALVLSGCGSPTAGNPDGTGGTHATGGSTGGSGNSTASGGSGTGGFTGAGGRSATGGNTAAGGSTGTGGLSSTGGNSGATGSGGMGGAANGGSTGRGGTTGSGGTPGAGGSTSGGGTLPWLKVVGNQIQIESTGQQVILRGVSLEGLRQQSTDPKYNINGVIDLITNKNDTHGSSPGWYPVLLRVPVDQSNSMSEINTLLKPTVDYATKKGLYVIVDLHYVDNPYNHIQEVNSFWTAVAPMFKDYSNVFYEPFNESKVQESWANYKPTMPAWVNLIRASRRRT